MKKRVIKKRGLDEVIVEPKVHGRYRDMVGYQCLMRVEQFEVIRRFGFRKLSEKISRLGEDIDRLDRVLLLVRVPRKLRYRHHQALPAIIPLTQQAQDIIDALDQRGWRPVDVMLKLIALRRYRRAYTPNGGQRLEDRDN